MFHVDGSFQTGNSCFDIGWNRPVLHVEHSHAEAAQVDIVIDEQILAAQLHVHAPPGVEGSREVVANRPGVVPHPLRRVRVAATDRVAAELNDGRSGDVLETRHLIHGIGHLEHRPQAPGVSEPSSPDFVDGSVAQHLRERVDDLIPRQLPHQPCRGMADRAARALVGNHFLVVRGAHRVAHPRRELLVETQAAHVDRPDAPQIDVERRIHAVGRERLRLALVLVVDEEVRLVAHDRATEGEAVPAGPSTAARAAG